MEKVTCVDLRNNLLVFGTETGNYREWEISCKFIIIMIKLYYYLIYHKSYILPFFIILKLINIH